MKTAKYIIILFTVFVLSYFAQQSYAQSKKLPGVAVDYISPATKTYVGSPSICILPNGNYIASHDYFGPNTTEHEMALTAVFKSTNKGKSWEKISEINGQFWSNLFVHQNELYIMGTWKHHGDFIVRRSSDGGHTWTEPTNSKNGLLLEGEYHTAPMPMVIHNGRIWRAIENAKADTKAWGKRYSAMVISAPVDADLLDAKSWTTSNWLFFNQEWPVGSAWIEGNIVVSPENKLVNILRVHEPKRGDYAAVINVSDDSKNVSFNPDKGFINFPGGSKKFVIRFDEKSKRYWALTNFKHDIGYNPERTRNCLALASSPDLKKWTVHEYILYHPDFVSHGFQYADWRIEGNDMLAVVRTAFDDGKVPPHNCHDANYLLFKRIKNFRKYEKKELMVYHKK